MTAVSLVPVLLVALAATAVATEVPAQPSRSARPGAGAAGLSAELGRYRANLDALRARNPAMRHLPDARFFLFGMGPRRKLLYRGGVLKDARSGEVLRSWKVTSELIVPSSYTVALTTAAGPVQIVEDETGVWLAEKGRRTALGTGAVKLPSFSDNRWGPVLRVLHQELLVNVIDGAPVPNFFVYTKPWYRDGAMVSMAFAKTGNVGLVKDWIVSLREPFDRNNRGEDEADNPGQVLYLISLVADRNHPLVPRILETLPRFHKGQHVEGRSDFGPHPVYQTKWANFGLRALGLPERYTVPRAEDTYSPLFWWDYKTAHVKGPRFDMDSGINYPYLVWAEDHFDGSKRGMVGDRDYPLTWEAKASQANYQGMALVGPEFVERKLSAPHTWHAAEMFLLLLEDGARQ